MGAVSSKGQQGEVQTGNPLYCCYDQQEIATTSGPIFTPDEQQYLQEKNLTPSVDENGRAFLLRGPNKFQATRDAQKMLKKIQKIKTDYTKSGDVALSPTRPHSGPDSSKSQSDSLSPGLLNPQDILIDSGSDDDSDAVVPEDNPISQGESLTDEPEVEDIGNQDPVYDSSNLMYGRRVRNVLPPLNLESIVEVDSQNDSESEVQSPRVPVSTRQLTREEKAIQKHLRNMKNGKKGRKQDTRGETMPGTTISKVGSKHFWSS